MKIELAPISIFLGLILTGATNVNGQDMTRTTLAWKASQVMDGRTSATKTSTTEFVTHSATSVDWIQRNGELRTTFRVLSVEGTWSDVKERGSVTYLVEYDNHSCKLLFERSDSGVSIVMDFETVPDASKRLTFQINSVNQ
jgi:hypothetical protein